MELGLKMNEFDLRFISPDDRNWQDFVQRQSDLNIFHSPNWLRLLETCYGFHPFVMAMCDSTGGICAGLPMMDVKHAFGKRRWISLPFSDYSVPLLSGSAALGSFAYLIKSSVDKSSTPATEIRWDFSNENPNPDYVLHTLSLDPDFEKVSRRIHHSHLRNVRTAQANGIQIRHGIGREEISAFYELHLQTRRRQGVPIQPRSYFTQLGELILEKGLGFISLAYHDSTCLAGAVFLHWKNTLTYKYGASTEAGLSLRPNHLIFYDAIQWGCENGYTLGRN
jgi:Acetyltransferase (GNAT) domain